MLNAHDLQNRTFVTMLESKELLTSRTSVSENGEVQYIYSGSAYPGSAEHDPVWLIKRIALHADGTSALLFAGGDALFNKAWSDRVSLVYA
ncbi:MAG: hypothetical protein HQL92_02410 [Magnetococcales bacterium]|nr:hypothetical protein [Magnetococcales bacterium]